jgi:hypothetical protein
MANTIVLKRSATPGKVPTTSQLSLGEIAINTHDGLIYIKKDDGTPSVVQIGGITSVNGETGAVVLDTGDIAENGNLYFTNARARSALSAGSGITYNSSTGAISTSQGLTSSSSPTFVNLTLTGGIPSISGSIIPSADITYDLGSPTRQWKDIYVGPGSLYVNGSKVLEDVNDTITFSADIDQNIRIKTTGSGILSLGSSATNVNVDGTLQIASGKRITDQSGIKVNFGNAVEMNGNKVIGLGAPSSNTDAATKKYVDDAIGAVSTSSIAQGNSNISVVDTGTGTVTVTVDGSTALTVDANGVVVAGNFTVSGTTTTINANTIALADNIITLNSDATGAPTQNAGIEVKRGDEANVQLRWNEGSTKWTFTNNGAVYYPMAVGTDDLAEGSTNLYFTNGRARSALSVTSNTGISYNSSTGVFNLGSIPNSSLTNNKVTIGSSDVSLGATATTLSGLSSVSSTSFTGALTGNADTATTLATGRTIAITGDITYTSPSFNGSSNVTAAATLATVNSNVGAFGSATAIPVITVNAKGLVTAVSTTAVSIPSGALTFTGDVTGTGTTGSSTALTISAGAVTNSMLAGSIALSKLAGLGTGVASALAVNTGSAGSFAVVGAAGGTPSSLTLTNATGLPISTGVSGLGTGVATFLGTPSSANLAAAVTDETGSGALVFGTSPTLTTPTLSGTTTISGNLIPGTDLAYDLGDATHRFRNLYLSGSTIAIAGSTSGTLTLAAPATAGTTTVTFPATSGTVITTGDSGTVTSTMIADGTIVNADINASAAIAYSKLSLTGSILNADLAGSIADTKLSTISTAGKVSNSATTATNANTASAIVARDASGNFTAGTITAALSGNASTATALQTARAINGVNFDGTAAITVTAAAGTLTGSTLASGVTASSLTSVGTITSGTWNGSAIADTYLGTISTAGKVSNSATTATSANTASAIVARDASGNFTAGTITANLTGNTTGTHTGAVTGNASTATALQTARTINGVSFDGTGNIVVHTAGTGISVSGTTVAVDTSTISTKSYVDTSISNLVNGASAAYDTLKEIQDLMATDAELSSAIAAISNVPSATKLQTARTINGTSFDGTANISFSTSAVSEGSNLYYTDARARAAVSFTAGSGAYNSSTGVFTIPTNTNQLTNGAGFITGYTETDTLSTVAARGNTSSTKLVTRQSGVSLSTGQSSQLEINNAGSGACNIAFHREGVYGAHFGLDTDNWFSTYGWSAGSGYSSMRVGSFAANGSITSTGEVTAYYSDVNLKTNIEVIPNALSKIEAIRGVTFDPNQTALDLGVDNTHQMGVIAQEIEAVAPELVVPSAFEGYKTVKYDKLTALLIEAVKELSAKVKTLEAQVNKTL